MGKRNYPLLIALTAVALFALNDVRTNIANPLSYAGAAWSWYVFLSITFAGITVELTGIYQRRPKEVVALFIAYVLILMLADPAMVSGGQGRSMFSALVAGLVILTFTLGTLIIFERGTNPLVHYAFGIGLLFLFVHLEWRDPAIATASLLSGWGIILMGGATAFSRRDEKGPWYAVGYLSASVILVALSFLFEFMLMGFSASF